MPSHRTVPAHRPAPARTPGTTPAEKGAPRLAKLALLGVVVGLAGLGEFGMRTALAPGSSLSAAAHAVTVLRFYAGVCTLVALSLTVAAGLLATDRILLAVRQRIWVQSAHRTLSLLAVVFLGLHVLTEVAGGRIGAVAVAIPLGAPLYVALGSVAAYLMVLVAWTGMIRSRFAGGARPWLWRLLHSVSYLCWPVSLLHGLRGGRPPAVWVTASYLLLALAVLVALAVRLRSERVRRKRLRQQGDRVPTHAVRVHSAPHRSRGRAAVSSRPVIEMSTSDMPTLVDLNSARVRRSAAAVQSGGGHRRTATASGGDWPAIRGEAR